VRKFHLTPETFPRNK